MARTFNAAALNTSRLRLDITLVAPGRGGGLRRQGKQTPGV